VSEGWSKAVVMYCHLYYVPSHGCACHCLVVVPVMVVALVARWRRGGGGGSVMTSSVVAPQAKL